MIETGLNKSLVVPMIGGESGFQVPKATPQSGLEQTKNDLIRIAKDRKPNDGGISPNQEPGLSERPRMTPKAVISPKKDIIVPAY